MIVDAVKIGSIFALILIVVFFTMIWLMRHIRYRISPSHFQVLLFRIPLRQFRLEDISTVSKHRRSGLTEKWHNTTRPAHRTLVLKLSRGLFRGVEITPRNRYVFRNDLEKAITRRRNPEPAEPQPRVIIVTD